MGSWSALAQSTGTPTTFSIRDCILYAQQNNSNLKVSRLDERIAQQQTNQVKGRGLPQINANGSFENRLKVPLLVIPGGFGGGVSPDSSGSNTGDNANGKGIPLGYKYNSALNAEITQMIYDPSFWVGLKAARYSSQLYQQTTQQVTEETAYNIANAYYQVIVAQKQWQLLQSNLKSTQQILATTELQFQNGVARKVDVSRLRVNASNLQSQIRQAELNMQQALNALKFQMGMSLKEQVVLTDTTLTFNQTEVVGTDAPDNYFENRIEYKILKTNLELQNLDRRNISSGYFPSLRAFANYGYQGQGADFGFFRTPNNGWVDYTTSSVGLRLSIPLFDGLQRSAQVRQSRLRFQQLEENMQLTKQSINLEVSNALTQYQNTLQRIQAEQDNVALAREVYDVTQLEFREGVGSSTDLVEAETSLRQTQNTFITTLLDWYTARLDLERAKGTLMDYLQSN
ncbi:TolC family protein [Adhaeribacter swui]|uniref:TolC family protein n=1 Tax=Adhaeribacter swui TaxID=2086471 RepID=A0A7G7GBY7_9BACT|nr:TolC family protein [Adhaeribacter swui]QNF34671.1 TolC family protein [Adhaeribacter swui]